MTRRRPVCLQPAYRAYLPAVTAALGLGVSGISVVPGSRHAAQFAIAGALEQIMNLAGPPRATALPGSRVAPAGGGSPARSGPGGQAGSGAGSGAPPLARQQAAASHRFLALPAAARHAWLVTHLAALRAGRITLSEIP